jgi:hypothetical protein
MCKYLSNFLTISVPDEDYSRDLSCALNSVSTCFITLYYHWVDTSAGGLFFSQGMIPAVVIASTLTWLIRYIARHIKSIFRKIVQFVVQA